MEFSQIKELISLVDSTTISDVEIEQDGFKLRIRKKEKEIIQASQAGEEKQALSQGTILPEPEHPQPQSSAGLVEVTAPMVGTFYRAPAPDASPYVQVGDMVEVGQVLFIIEAMKMMNEIVAETSGVVKQVLVENGKPVQFGQALLLIEPRD